jgi:hypothetical protein
VREREREIPNQDFFGIQSSSPKSGSMVWEQAALPFGKKWFGNKRKKS